MTRFFTPPVTPCNARQVLQSCDVIPGKKPPRVAYNLANLGGARWTIISSNLGLLQNLTYHIRSVQNKNNLRKVKLTHDQAASLGLNRFLANVRAFGFNKTRKAYQQFEHNRVRRSAILHSVFHNHFGTHPEYIIEYQVFPETPCEIYLSTRHPSTFAIEGPAYVRFEGSLFYVYKQHNVCKQLTLDAETLEKFDKQLKTPTEINKGRELNEDELRTATLLTGFSHLHRILLVTNVDKHENFPFQKDAASLEKHVNAIAQAKLAELESPKNITESMLNHELKDYMAAEPPGARAAASPA